MLELYPEEDDISKELSLVVEEVDEEHENNLGNI